MLRNRGFGHVVYLLHCGLMIYLQTEEENARQHQRCKNSRSMFTACLLVHSEDMFPGLMKHAVLPPGGRIREHFGFSWCDSVGGFSGSTLPPFQLRMQFGGHRHCQQPRLCCALIRFQNTAKLLWLHSAVFLAASASQCGLQVTHKPSTCSSCFPAGPMASSQASQQEKLSLSICSLSPGWSITQPFALETCLFLISCYERYISGWVFFFFGKYFMIY